VSKILIGVDRWAAKLSRPSQKVNAVNSKCDRRLNSQQWAFFISRQVQLNQEKHWQSILPVMFFIQYMLNRQTFLKSDFKSVQNGFLAHIFAMQLRISDPNDGANSNLKERKMPRLQWQFARAGLWIWFRTSISVSFAIQSWFVGRILTHPCQYLIPDCLVADIREFSLSTNVVKVSGSVQKKPKAVWAPPSGEERHNSLAYRTADVQKWVVAGYDQTLSCERIESDEQFWNVSVLDSASWCSHSHTIGWSNRFCWPFAVAGNGWSKHLGRTKAI
jgi:hypothetical protein